MTDINILFGVISNGLTLGKGDLLNISSGGVATNIVIGAKANMVVSSGGSATATQVQSRGSELVDAGGTVSATLVFAGGAEQLNAGGVASGTVITGGNAYVSGGTEQFAVVSSGNEYVYSGGTAHGATVAAKGKLFVFSGGLASGTVLDQGYEYAFSAGVISATVALSGGVVNVQTSGRGFDSLISSGAQETVFAEGISTDTTVLAGGFQLVYGETEGAIIHGAQNVYPGGVASGTVIDAGAIQLVSAGMVLDTVVNSGGQEVLLIDSLASGTQLNAGGTIDLPNLFFVPGGSAVLNPQTDVLTITEGLSKYLLPLSGSYDANAFQLNPDNDFGTLLTLNGGTSQLPPAARTFQWSGFIGGAFAVPANWNDVSDGIDPSLAVPGILDTVQFLSGDASIVGDGAASTLRFGGDMSWHVTSGANLTAVTSVTVGSGGVSALLIDAGANVTGLGVCDEISGDAGEAASVTVDGLGSRWRSGGELVAGALGSGALTVSNGASVSATAAGSLPAMVLGLDAGGAGSLLVEGTGSQATLLGQLDVGMAGAGTLTVANRATLLTGNDAALDPTEGLDIAALAGAAGQATVIGANARLSNVGRFIVGDAGVGSLAIVAGAAVATSPNGVQGLDGMVVANKSGAGGSSVEVSGPGSRLDVIGTLVVGAEGYGLLAISNGASATAAVLDLASGATGDGAVSVVGVGSSLDVGGLILGDQAAAELSILNGAQMSIGGGLVGGAGGAPGNLDIEGNGSALTINSGTLVVGANGPAEFTLGIGATLKGQLATALFGVTNLYGNVDPATDPNDGTQNVGFDNSLLYDFYVANSGTIKVISGSATYYTPLVTDETNAQDGSVNGLWMIGAKDTLVMNATSVDNTQTFDLTSATSATLVIGQVPQSDPNSQETFNGQTMPTLTGSIAPGAANVLPGWQAPIENYQAGDVIRLQGLTYGSATASGDVVTVWSDPAGQGSALGSLTFIDKSGSTTSVAALASATAAAAQINTLACFAAGTRIATEHGWVKVEDLRVGDRVRTMPPTSSPSADLIGGPDPKTVVEPIIWIGSRTVNCAAHPKPATVRPVRVARGAFGDNVPSRDLYVSPDHAIYINGVLIPARHLLNGTTITQTKRRRVTYYHVELPEHAVILAENLPVESYLDIGDRAEFTSPATIRLFPDRAAGHRPSPAMLWETNGIAPLIVAGPILARARSGIAASR